VQFHFSKLLGLGAKKQHYGNILNINFKPHTTHSAVEIPSLKPAKIPYIMMWPHWLGNTKPKKAFRLILNDFKKLLQNFKRNLFNGIFY